VVKHVIVERPLPGRAEDFVAVARRLWEVIAARGWVNYDAWPMVAADEGEPALFDLGILGRALRPSAVTFVFEATFPDQATLEAQLHAMRTDREVVSIILEAAETIDPRASRAYVLQHWSTSRFNPDATAGASRTSVLPR
jgi:hypothetical protein